MFVLKIADGLPDAEPIVMGHRRWTPRGAVTIPESEHSLVTSQVSDLHHTSYWCFFLVPAVSFWGVYLGMIFLLTDEFFTLVLQWVEHIPTM